MTYIYVLSLRDNNLFLQMTVISATLLRKISPQAKILIAIDEITDLKKYSVEYELLLNLNVEILIVKTGFSNCVLSSRFIKLSLPNLVNEQFWYLDSDTLPLINTDSTQISGDIGMVRDLNRGASDFVLNENRVANCKAMNWPIPEYPYCNSGVMFLKYSSQVKELFQQAHEIWSSACNEGINCGDQLPLNIAAQQMPNINVTLLDDSYNAQIRSVPRLAPKAKILHIFSGSLTKHNDTLLHVLIDNLRGKGVLRTDILDRLLESRNPWVKQSRQWWFFPIRKILS